MDEWNTRQHGNSGLTQRVRESTITLARAEVDTIEFLQQWVPKGKSPMCGNSICQDRRFLARGMPTLERYFHYRNLDVSTIKELARRWRPAEAEGVKKSGAHLALDDIKASLAELEHYRHAFFKFSRLKPTLTNSPPPEGWQAKPDGVAPKQKDPPRPDRHLSGEGNIPQPKATTDAQSNRSLRP